VNVPDAFFGEINNGGGPNAPGPRSSAILRFDDGDNVTVYGGVQANGGHVQDAWSYSMKDKAWAVCDDCIRVRVLC
jgi:hypothetical protein